MFKLPYNCTHFTCQQSNAQNPSGQTSTVYETRTSRYTSWMQKRQRTRRSNCQLHWIIEKAREFHKNVCLCFIDYVKAFNYVDHNKPQRFLKEMGIPDYLTCLLRNLYAGQEATVRTGHEMMDWFKTEKVLCQACILPCIFNLYAEYIMPDWMKHKLESRLPEEISTTSNMQMIPLGRKQK